MTERPMLMSAPMVRAILAGTKTQTRRVVKPQPDSRPGMNCTRLVFKDRRGRMLLDEALEAPDPKTYVSLCPYGVPGDRLWVRETWMDLQGTGVEHRDRAGKLQQFAYGADTPAGSYGDEARKDYGLKWRPSIHMPRAASRITLEITGVRVERLQDINTADCWAEGIASSPDVDPVHEYRDLWQSINGPGSWDVNPWVWVVEFRTVAG